ncbi:unnamed protein product [Rotaria magnacalcarata]|uniref:Uncharacterized protein n=2 Tax=Rotaria magnacalcarata TaxID=392030 RepID=A0A820L2N1_9BILA|nr:unnamed protein product [Rotaria magnacalcarata]
MHHRLNGNRACSQLSEQYIIVVCLHPNRRKYNSVTDTVADALSFDYPTAPYGVYCVDDINELNNGVKNWDRCVSAIGWGDFPIFDVLLLLVIPCNSSIIIRACIAFGCIVSVELANLCTGFILYFSDFNGLPALPLPTAVVSAYAIFVGAIIEYLNLDCEDTLKWRTSLHYDFSYYHNSLMK